MSAKSEFQARENQTVEARTRGRYVGAIERHMRGWSEDEIYGVLFRIILKLPIALRRRLFIAIHNDLAGHVRREPARVFGSKSVLGPDWD